MACAFWCQAIILTRAAILSIRHWRTYFNETLLKINRFHSRKCRWRCSLRNGSHFVSASVYQQRRSRYIPLTGNLRRTWWRHAMETLSALLVFYRPSVDSPPPKKRSVMQSLYSLLLAYTSCSINNRVGDLRRNDAHMTSQCEQYTLFSTLVQVMAWCRQAPSHYLNQRT